MIRPLTFCVAMASFWVAHSPCALAEGVPECELTRLASVQTDMMADGRITIPVTVQDHPLSFLVDTGGISTTIKWEQAKLLGLSVRQTSQKLQGVAGSLLNFYVTGNNISVGELRVKDLPMYLESRTTIDADGTFSSDILRRYDVDFDFAHDALTLLSPNHCHGHVVTWTKTGSLAIPMDVGRSGHVRIPVTLDGKSIMATLDTGSATSWISLKAAAGLGIGPNTPGLAPMPYAGEGQVYAYTFHALDFGGLSQMSPTIAIVSDNIVEGMGGDLVLGIDVLRQMHLYIAYDEKKLYLTDALAN
jgi:predicted aspartyl protease